MPRPIGHTPNAPAHGTTPFTVARMLARYVAVRTATDRLCDPLAPDDYQVQSRPECNPVKWHLGHTTWFFETYVLIPHAPNYRAYNPAYGQLFGSAVASHPGYAANRRGALSRPTVTEVIRYRSQVDEVMQRWLVESGGDISPEVEAVIEYGLNHEQQHQELILASVKDALGRNPLLPAYAPKAPLPKPGSNGPPNWEVFAGGLVELGHSGIGFGFPDEDPRYRAFLRPFALASKLVTIGEYRRFIQDSGYARPELWSHDGWATRMAYGWIGPDHWHQTGDRADVFTLGGLRPTLESEPVTHVSSYEAEAYARWAGARLATEAEWEHAATGIDPNTGNYLESGAFHPLPTKQDGPGLQQMFGDCWEWTASAYSYYPGYKQPIASGSGPPVEPFPGLRQVLRGGSCLSPRGHLRATYRHTLTPDARWQFTGIRLAKNV